MSHDVLFPDIPQSSALYRVTVTMSRPVDDDGFPTGRLVPPAGQTAVELAAVPVVAGDVITAWMARTTIVSMIVRAASRSAAEEKGREIARELGACEAGVSAEAWGQGVSAASSSAD